VTTEGCEVVACVGGPLDGGAVYINATCSRLGTFLHMTPGPTHNKDLFRAYSDSGRRDENGLRIFVLGKKVPA
jgi:hypothetical protein